MRTLLLVLLLSCAPESRGDNTAGPSDDAHEPNNSPDEAAELFCGLPINGTAADPDWFAVETTVEGPVAVSLSWSDADAELLLRLRSNDVELPCDPPGALGAGCGATLPAGIHQLGVIPQDDSAAAYALSAICTGVAPGDDDDAVGDDDDSSDPCADGVGLDQDGDTYRTCGLEELIDCDDGDSTIHPGAEETCGDDVDNDCSGLVDDLDADGDGHVSEACGGSDCDDGNLDVHPDQPESCDSVDNDCDGQIDDGFDADDDGWTSCAGDCENADPAIHPDAVELCDGLDNDCDCLWTGCGPGDEGVDEDFDVDGDGFIDAANPFCADIYGPAADGSEFGDCDDGDGMVFPEAHEDSTDGADNDCDGCTDECFDHDGDGWDNCAPGDAGDPSCTEPAQGGGDDGLEADCRDSPSDLMAGVIHPDFTYQDTLMDGTPITLDEQCDGQDNDCDGTIDEGYDSNCDPLE